ncbi:MAG: FecR domain-containing protein [Verrucomicrobiia bacterium]
MKYIQTLITMLVGGVVLALGSSAVAQTIKPCMVTVVRIQGQARYSLGDNVWHPLLVGKILRSGAIIQSAANSTVDIVFSDEPIAMPQAALSPDSIGLAPDPNVRGLLSYKPMVQQNVIRMYGNTVLAVDKLTQFDSGVDTVSDTELDLRAGRIFFNVKKMSATSQFIIKIPNGVAGIRGSSGIFDATGQVWMFTGEIIIALPNGQTITVDGGFDYNPQTNQVTQVSKKVLEELQNNGIAVQTLYLLDISYAPNNGGQNLATVYCSPTTGNNK